MNRQKLIVRTGVIGIATNIVLVIFKMLVGVMAGSIAIILDAVNNLTDVLSSVVTIIGAKVAARQPDRGHPYGHGRSEYVAALMVGLIILATGVASLVEAVPKIFHAELADYSWATLTVVISAIIAKILLGLYTRRMGHKLNSGSLLASGVDALFDVLLSAATLVGVIVTMLFQISIDGILGVIIALFIVRTSIGIIMGALDDILGRTADRKLIEKMNKMICSFPQVSGAYDLMLHNYGPTDLIGSVQIQVSEDLTAKDLHRLTREISQKALTRYGVMLTVGVYAENGDETEHREIKEYLLGLINEHPEVRQMHAFYIDEDEKLITFDLMMSYQCEEKIRLKNKIVQAMKRRFPDYQYMVTIDIDVNEE